MVLAVLPGIGSTEGVGAADSEGAEATDLGEFVGLGAARRYHVGRSTFSMGFLHEGRLAVIREATGRSEEQPLRLLTRRDFTDDLLGARELGRRCKEWIIRQYDQGRGPG